VYYASSDNAADKIPNNTLTVGDFEDFHADATKADEPVKIDQVIEVEIGGGDANPLNDRWPMMQINNLSLLTPPVVMLSDMDKIPNNMFCNLTDGGHGACKERDHTWCQCVQLVHVKYGSMVEMHIQNRRRYPTPDMNAGINNYLFHPFHIHGFKWRLVARGYATDDDFVTLESLRAFDKSGGIKRSQSGPLKDTVMTSMGGYSILQFKADQRGTWLLHCGYDDYMAWAMGMIILVE